MISFHNITKRFDSKEVLKGISFTIEKGETLGIVGPNGAGKTTIINILLGFLKPDSGRALFMDTPIWENKSSVVKNFGVVQENPLFFPEFTAEENLRYFSSLSGSSRDNIRELIEKVGLEKSRRTVFSKYSLGMKQRLNIAFALLNDPDILIFDEPTNGLDPVGIKDVRNIIEEFSNQGKTIILCSHILSEVEKVCSRAIVIKEGNVLDKIQIKGQQLAEKIYEIRHSSIKKVLSVLKKSKDIKVIFSDDSKCLLEVPPSKDGSFINQKLAEDGVFVSEIFLSNNFESDVLEKINE